MPGMLAEAEALYNAGKIEEAEHHFLNLLNAQPDDKESLNNLGVIAAGRNQYGRATEYFTQALNIDPTYIDALINFCELLRLTGNLGQGRKFLKIASAAYPDDESLTALLAEAGRVTPTPVDTVPALPDKIEARVAFLAMPGMESFLGDILEFLNPRCEVKTCFSGAIPEITAAVEWADVVWVEWANEMAVQLTEALPQDWPKRIICRLHSYEAFADFLPEIKWERIDDLIFVAEHIKDHVLARVPDLDERVGRMHVIPNGVDLKKFPYIERQKGKSLAYLGYINYKKGPMLLLHAFAELVRHDSQYQLAIAGKFQDDRYALYYNQMVRAMGLNNNIRFDGWVDDVPGWLADKQYILSTSVLESQGMGIMQAMACGLKPIVHNFVGAGDIYRPKHLWNTIPEFVDRVLEDDYDSYQYRMYIENRYDHEKQMAQLVGLLQPLEDKGPESHCGPGSYLEHTKEIRQYLPSILKRYDIKSMIDVPCGDWNWMQKVDLTGIDYFGYDNDEGFIETNRRLFPQHRFETVDATKAQWPKADLILCRDFAIHLKDDDIVNLLESFKKSGARYLLTTSYDNLTENVDFSEAQKERDYRRLSRPSRAVNLEIEPYRLGAPLESVRENSGDACQNRIVGLWKLN
ncbi:MAG: glycosyltransferase [FCB group bacterium]|nr:glycosyltransferase [FCB group bacterium]